MSEIAKLASKLSSEGDQLVTYLARLGEAEWTTEIYAEGSSWTVRSILAHIVSAERAFLQLFDQISRGGAGVGDDFDIDRFNERQQHIARDVQSSQLLAQFQDARGRMVDFVSALQDSALDLRGRHPFLGVTSLRAMVRMVYLHNHTHLRDIRRALEAGQAF